jgi:hypothetical protein
LNLAGLQPKTIEAYSRAIRRISNYFDCRIENLTTDQLLNYFNDLLTSHSWSAVKLDLYGLKFFYTNMLESGVDLVELQKIPVTKRPSGPWSTAGMSMARICWRNAAIMTAAQEDIFPTPAVTEAAPIARTMKISSGSKINWTSCFRPNTT